MVWSGKRGEMRTNEVVSKLRRVFRHFPDDIGWQPPGWNPRPGQSPGGLACPNGPTTAAHGNVLETVNMARAGAQLSSERLRGSPGA